jgi:hypothetical protein
MRRKRFRWSDVVWWACQDLNLGPHPYQVSRAKRCADRRFPRSLASVRGQGMRSYSSALLTHGHDAVAAGKVCQRPVADKAMGLPVARQPHRSRDRDGRQVACPSRVLPRAPSRRPCWSARLGGPATRQGQATAWWGPSAIAAVVCSSAMARPRANWGLQVDLRRDLLDAGDRHGDELVKGEPQR